ncbi:MAG: hypothetical protein ACSLEL_02150 [Candidatus Malihini olakiniferum]
MVAYAQIVLQAQASMFVVFIDTPTSQNPLSLAKNNLQYTSLVKIRRV